MGNRFVFISDLHASEIGMDYEMGLLYSKGQIVDDLLPGMEELLLLKKKILPESDYWQRQAGAARSPEAKAKEAPENKRGRGAERNKAR